jgi:hypothetical protein
MSGICIENKYVSLALGSQSPWEIKEISFNTVNSKRVLD